MWRTDREHRRLRLREAHAAVVSVPDVADTHRFLWARVEVPMLPVEECALRDSRRARERQGAAEYRACRDQRQPARPFGHAGEQRERDCQDREPAAELVAAGKKRRRPAGGEKEEHDREERPARGHRERDGKGETEDRNQDDCVHLGMRRGIDRQAIVVEVEEAARKPGAERSEETSSAGPDRPR